MEITKTQIRLLVLSCVLFAVGISSSYVIFRYTSVSPSRRALPAMASPVDADFEKIVASSSGNVAPTSRVHPVGVSAFTTSTSVSDDSKNTSSSSSSVSPVLHVPLPTEVRGFYWTGYTAGSARVASLMAYASSSHLNSVVIDAKMDDGTLSFVPRDPQLSGVAPKHPIVQDLDNLLERLRGQGLYRIARISIMRDGLFGKLHPSVVLRNADGSAWYDKTGSPWLDPAAPEVSEYAIRLAREVYARGFDEVQFDYVRFPSDGRLSAIHYPVYDGKTSKSTVMRGFFQRVGGSLQASQIPVSFDLFGLTFWATDDLGIGQRLSDVYGYADQISPMVYPSHFNRGFQGFTNPAQYPYEVVKRSLDKGSEILKAEDPQTDVSHAAKKFRPWIQDFDLGAVYDATKVRAQIKAARDAGASGWLIWNARNVYTPMRYF